MNCSGSREEIKEFIEKNLGQNFVSDLNPNLNSDLASNCIKSNLKFLNFLTTCIYVNDERYVYNRIYVIIFYINLLEPFARNFER